MKSLEIQAEEKLKALLSNVPSIEFEGIESDAPISGSQVDILVTIRASGHRHKFVCEVKSNGQPRYARDALFQLHRLVDQSDHETTGIFIAPYVSSASQALCQEYGVGFLDFQGNARIVFDGVFIERRVADVPPAERRELKSLFRPKAAQVLLTMLRDPERHWRVVDLANAAGVSLGHVSNVRNALLAREWAQAGANGIFLTAPSDLLDEWRDVYESPVGQTLRFYTVLHGNDFEEAVRKALNDGPGEIHVVLASFSAAQWLAPYARISTHFFYADEIGLERLVEVLSLTSAAKGENVVINVPKDQTLFRDSVEPAEGIVCTSPVRTYLDLTRAGERGKEAAEHLRRAMLSWPK